LQRRPYRNALKTSEFPPKYPEKENLQKGRPGLAFQALYAAIRFGRNRVSEALERSCCIEDNQVASA